MHCAAVFAVMSVLLAPWAPARASATRPPPVTPKHRLFVLTDIEADPDDTQSLIRLLLYSNEIDLVGLTATTSAPQPARVAPQSIHEVIDEYAKVRPNLLVHSSAYPAAERLHALVHAGPPLYGLKGVGSGHDSSGSDALVRALEDPDTRPLWVTAWGGVNVLAQALFKIRSSKSQEQADAFYRKLRVYTISDQDDSGSWIRRNFPTVFYIVSPGDWGQATWMGMANRLPHSDLDVISDPWIARNIQQNHGPLGAAYPDVAYGMEGDTPSFLGLIPNGLNDLEHPNWGSWGGRYELYRPGRLPKGPVEVGSEPETRPIWTNAVDAYAPISSDPLPPGPPAPPAPRGPAFEVKDNYVTIWRWRTAFQNDFAARMNWTVKTFAEANHPPLVHINGPRELTVRAGETFSLDATGTTDPDGDSLSYYWFQYREAGTYPGELPFGLSPKLKNLHTIKAPTVTKPETVHFIVAVTDKGTPSLTRYGRILVTILPNQASP